MDIPEKINQESPTKERLKTIAQRLMQEYSDEYPLGSPDLIEPAVIGALIEYVKLLEKRIEALEKGVDK